MSENERNTLIINHGQFSKVYLIDRISYASCKDSLYYKDIMVKSKGKEVHSIESFRGMANKK